MASTTTNKVSFQDEPVDPGENKRGEEFLASPDRAHRDKKQKGDESASDASEEMEVVFADAKSTEEDALEDIDTIKETGDAMDTEAGDQEVTEEKQAEDTDMQVEPTANPKVISPDKDTTRAKAISRGHRWPKLTMGKTPCDKNRKRMEYLSLTIRADPGGIKDGNLDRHIVSKLKKAFIAAQKLDTKFVWYRYGVEEKEPNSILDVRKFPDDFKTLQGVTTERNKDCYVHNLRVWVPQNNKNLVVYTKIRVGYESNDFLEQWTKHFKTLIPAWSVYKKDLQAPQTVEIGYLWGAPESLQPKATTKVLRSIFVDYALRKTPPDPPLMFALQSKLLLSGDKDSKTRALHVKVRTDDRERATGYFKAAVTTKTWKLFTNCYVELKPTVRSHPKEKERVYKMIKSHRRTQADILSFETRDFVALDIRNEFVFNEDGKQATIRSLLMEMTVPADMPKIVNGERIVKTVQVPLFLTADHHWKNQDTFVITYPKDYEMLAVNRLRGLYAYLVWKLSSDELANEHDIERDLSIWFTEEAREKRKLMAVEDGIVIDEAEMEDPRTLENASGMSYIHQEDFKKFLEEEQINDTSTTKGRTARARAFQPKTGSVGTQNTTPSQNVANALREAASTAGTLGGLSNPSTTDSPTQATGNEPQPALPEGAGDGV